MLKKWKKYKKRTKQNDRKGCLEKEKKCEIKGNWKLE